MNPQSSNHQSGIAVKLSPATAGALILLIAFFLPWVYILGTGVGGHQLRQIWEPGPFLFSIPILAAITLLLGVSGKPNVVVGQLTGGVPFIFLAVALYQFGSELFQAIGIGAYLTLASGFFLLCIAPRLGRKRAASGASAASQSNATEHEAEIER